MRFSSMTYNVSIRKLAVTASILAISACSSTIHTTSTLGNHKILALDAKQRVIISGTRQDGQHVICAEPSPDALVASASYAAATLNKEDDIAAQAAIGRSESVASLGVRTQTIQLLRDGYYRICEAYLNGALDHDDYDAVIQSIDVFMITLVAIQSVGGVVAAPAVSINATGNVNIGKDGEISGGNKTEKAAFSNAMAMTSGLSPNQVGAIVKMVETYLKLKR